MNYHHFTIEECCCLQEYQRKKLSGNRATFRQERLFRIEGIEAELHVFQGYSEILSAYGAKEKRSAQQLPSPGDVLETRGIGLRRREAVANMAIGTDSVHLPAGGR